MRPQSIAHGLVIECALSDCAIKRSDLCYGLRDVCELSGSVVNLDIPSASCARCLVVPTELVRGAADRRWRARRTVKVKVAARSGHVCIGSFVLYMFVFHDGGGAKLVAIDEMRHSLRHVSAAQIRKHSDIVLQTF